MPIDLLNPVADHPLNSGLVSWWLPLPNNWGGAYLYDLKAPVAGVLTGSPAWTRQLAPLGALSFTTSQGAQVTAPASVRLPWPLSVSAWVRVNGTPDDNAAVWGLTYDNVDGNPYLGYDIYWSSFPGAGQPRFAIGYNAGVGVFSYYGASGVNPASYVGQWVLLTAVVTSAGGSLYLNGASVADTQAGSLPSAGNPAYASTALQVAGNYSAVSRNPNITFGSGWIHDRALSAGEAFALYDQSQRGFPNLLRQYRRQRTFLLLRDSGGGGTVTGVGSAAGTCTVSGVGRSTAASPGAAAGTCTVAGVGRSTAASPGAAAGTCTVAGVGRSTAASPGTASGTCTVAGVGQSTARAVGDAAGTCTVLGYTSGVFTAAGSASGTCTVAGVGQSTARAAGAAAGTSTAAGAGASTARSPGSASGTCTVAGVGRSTWRAAGSASGTCTVLGVSTGTVTAAGAAAGTCTVSGVSSSAAVVSGGTWTLRDPGVSWTLRDPGRTWRITRP